MTVASGLSRRVDRGERRRARVSAIRTTWTAVLVAIVGIWTAVGLGVAGASMLVLAPLAVTVGLGLLVLGLRDFPSFVLAALVIRSGLDALGPWGPINPGAVLGLALLGLGSVWLMLRSRDSLGWRPSSLGAGFIVLSIAGGISVLVSRSPAASAQEWARLTGIVVVYLVVEELARRGAQIRPFVIAILAALAVPVAVAMTQMVSGEGLLDRGGFSRVTGSFRHANPLAYFLVVVGLLALGLVLSRRRWTSLTIAAAGIVIAVVPVLVATFTRSAWLVLVLGAAAMLIHFPRRYLVGLLAVGVAVVVAVPGVGERFADLGEEEHASGTPGNSWEWRIRYWGESMALVEDSPITGLGLNAVANTQDEAKPPHSDYVRTYVETGVLGALGMLWVAVAALRRTYQAAIHARDHPDLPMHERGVGFASAGVAVAFVTLAAVANLITQVVVMLYVVTVLALASGVLTRWQDGRLVGPVGVDDARSSRQ